MSIILASNSPRRRELLAQIGIRDFQILSPDVDEAVEPGLSPARMVEELSLRKARAAAGRAGAEDLIIAADTVVALDGRVLGKPQDEGDAFAMLSALSGREHRVYTGVTVLGGGQAATEHEETAYGQGGGLWHPGRGRAAGPGHPGGLLQCGGPAGVPAGADAVRLRREAAPPVNPW